MRRPAGRKASPKKEARKSNHAAAAKGAALADLITTAPRLSDPDVARSRVSDWLADVSSADSKSLKSLLSKQPIIGTLVNSLAESSPYLWDLTTREPERLLRLLLANPEQHFATLLRDHGHAAAVSKDEAEAMRELRRMKTEAALLIALADIGGVWSVMRTAHALTELADAAVNGAVRFALAEAGRARRLVLKDKTKTQAGSGYIVLAMGKMGAFELNYSSDIDLIACGCRAIDALCAPYAAAGEAAAGTDRRRLRFPYRPASKA
jgi:glutamate-ammonia-ligase adenylyltransferase